MSMRDDMKAQGPNYNACIANMKRLVSDISLNLDRMPLCSFGKRHAAIMPRISLCRVSQSTCIVLMPHCIHPQTAAGCGPFSSLSSAMASMSSSPSSGSIHLHHECQIVARAPLAIDTRLATACTPLRLYSTSRVMLLSCRLSGDCAGPPS